MQKEHISTLKKRTQKYTQVVGFFFFFKSNASQIIVFYVRKRVSLSKWPRKEQWMLYNELLCQAADLPTTAYEHPVSKVPLGP